MSFRERFGLVAKMLFLDLKSHHNIDTRHAKRVRLIDSISKVVYNTFHALRGGPMVTTLGCLSHARGVYKCYNSLHFVFWDSSNQRAHIISAEGDMY